MSEYQIVKHCAPTLAGLKTGSLIRVRLSDLQEFNSNIQAISKKLNSKGIYILPLISFKSFVLLYIFRPSNLAKILDNPSAVNLLKKLDYDISSVSGLIKSLKSRLVSYANNEDFPHEIGFFLGYPSGDVISFFENKGKNYLLSGPWKVYHDVCSAKCLFDKHKKCTNIYCKCYNAGISLERLAVSGKHFM